MMIKKILLGTLFVGLIGILVTGAIVRTLDRTELVAEAQGNGYGHGRDHGETNEPVGDESGPGYGQGTNQGRGGYGQSAARDSAFERQYPNYEAPPEEWFEYEGTVVQAPGTGVDLVIRTDDGQELTVGTGPDYMASRGFTLQAGDPVQVWGYWEDGELKATQVTRLTDGQTIALRDEMGRPAWAGAGRNAQGGYGDAGREDAPGDRKGTGQADVGEWLTLQGTVASVDSNALVVQTRDGEQVTVENRAWWFAQDQGFSAQVGDEVRLTGFYEGDELEVGQIDDITTGQTVLVRDENGRPLWAGQGRGSGGRGRRGV
jgi:hypothetical protein